MMPPDPLKPSPALLCKLGSLIVHADELLSPSGHPYDRTAFVEGLKDAEVTEWINQMHAMSMLPRKR
jgi:cystathionine beta-lyase family protein involved in aluminum resistance